MKKRYLAILPIVVAIAYVSQAAFATNVNRKQAEPVSRRGKYGGTFTNMTYGMPRTFNLWVSADANSSGVMTPLFSGLIEQNPYTLEWQPALASLPKPVGDGFTWTITLKDGLKWSDGQALTADDIIFTLDVLYDSKVGSNFRESMTFDVANGRGGFVRKSVAYKKLNSRSVQVRFPRKVGNVFNFFSLQVAPKHKLNAFWKQGQPLSTAFSAAWGTDMDPTEIVGSGPWVISGFYWEKQIVYSRNPNYWKKDDWGRPLPYLDKMITRFGTTDSTDSREFLAGRLDTVSLRQDNYGTVKAREKKGGYRVYDLGPSFGTSFLSFNMTMKSKPAKANPELFKLFNDVRFRQAVSHTVDRERIAKQAYGGLAKPGYGPESPANATFFDPNIPKFSFNLTIAKQKLATMGLRDSNGDGFLELRSKKPIQFTILTNVENSARVTTARIIAENLRKVGIKASVSALAFNALISRMDRWSANAPYDWQAMVLGFTGGLDPENSSNIWLSSGNLHQWDPDQKKPARPWEARIDQLFRQAKVESDLAKRKAIFSEFQRIVGQQQPLIYTVVPNVQAGIRKRFGNLKPCPIGGVEWNLDELYDLKATRETP